MSGSILTGIQMADVRLRPHSRVPKVREYAEITLMDGSTLSGYVFVDATARVQDLLNGPNAFFPFVDKSEQIILLNKASIMHVRPSDDT
jgi:hypothetical protein